MAWAWRYSKTGKDPVLMGLRERANIPILLKLFDRHKIPITWATVGHLFLESCEQINGKAHPELRRLPHTDDHWQFTNGDWYDHDPCTHWKEANVWYAPDLIDDILQSNVNHEIGCHSFSHLNCSDRYCPSEVLDDELARCVYLANCKGIRLRSMVFPGGTNGNYAILKKHGFSCCRYNDPKWDLFYPEKDAYGLLRLPSSASIGADPFSWSLSYRMKRYRAYIDKAIQRRTVCHLWFHPSLDEHARDAVLPALLEYADCQRDAGNLWCTTMDGLSSFCENKGVFPYRDNHNPNVA
jgi:peptidoglycan/xylan/chitin deacetylase (PgdA/CDA1 family)